METKKQWQKNAGQANKSILKQIVDGFKSLLVPDSSLKAFKLALHDSIDYTINVRADDETALITYDTLEDDRFVINRELLDDMVNFVNVTGVDALEHAQECQEYISSLFSNANVLVGPIEGTDDVRQYTDPVGGNIAMTSEYFHAFAFFAALEASYV